MEISSVSLISSRSSLVLVSSAFVLLRPWRLTTQLQGQTQRCHPSIGKDLRLLSREVWGIAEALSPLHWCCTSTATVIRSWLVQNVQGSFISPLTTTIKGREWDIASQPFIWSPFLSLHSLISTLTERVAKRLTTHAFHLPEGPTLRIGEFLTGHGQMDG